MAYLIGLWVLLNFMFRTILAAIIASLGVGAIFVFAGEINLNVLEWHWALRAIFVLWCAGCMGFVLDMRND